MMSAPNSPKTKRGANGKFLPKPLLFHLRHPNSKTNERTRQFRATTRSARAIRSFRQDYQQNTFELCLIHTASNRNSNFRQKYGRREAPSVLHSPQKTLNQKGFSTLRVARRLPIQFYE